jgi:hypothetical protein
VLVAEIRGDLEAALEQFAETLRVWASSNFPKIMWSLRAKFPHSSLKKIGSQR